MPTNLSKVATERGIKYFLISFVDLFGSLRSKLVPARAIADMQKNGAGFAGFAAWLDMTPADSDMFSIPDPDSLIQLPWKPEVGWLAGDLAMDGKPVEASPRVALKQQIKRAENLGFRMKTGVECEYFLVSADGLSISDLNDTQEKPCYDQSALMRQYDVISEICDSMIELGWGPYQNDHEDANGQFEMNWDYDDALVTADRHVFFKYMVKAITEKHGLRATFMPKPLFGDNGSGMHVHSSVWKNGETLMYKKGNYADLSDFALHYIGGILKHAPALLALCAPTTNSYKRLVPGFEAPVNIAYSEANRTASVRIPNNYTSSPKAKRIEFRCPDPSSNPYLAFSSILMAGLDGVKNKIDPGKPTDINIYEAPADILEKIPSTPESLAEALKALEKDHAFLLEGGVFTKENIKTYISYKRENEVNPINLRPHPHEFHLYYDA